MAPRRQLLRVYGHRVHRRRSFHLSRCPRWKCRWRLQVERYHKNSGSKRTNLRTLLKVSFSRHVLKSCNTKPAVGITSGARTTIAVDQRAATSRSTLRTGGVVGPSRRNDTDGREPDERAGLLLAELIDRDPHRPA